MSNHHHHQQNSALQQQQTQFFATANQQQAIFYQAQAQAADRFQQVLFLHNSFDLRVNLQIRIGKNAYFQKKLSIFMINYQSNIVKFYR
jgi:hypothetical protein